MGLLRKSLRSVFSIGGYDGISPIAKQSETNRLLQDIRDAQCGKPRKPPKNPYLYDWSQLGK